MKRISSFFIPSLLLVSFCVIGQMQYVGSNATVIAPSAVFEMESTGRLLVLPFVASRNKMHTVTVKKKILTVLR